MTHFCFHIIFQQVGTIRKINKDILSNWSSLPYLIWNAKERHMVSQHHSFFHEIQQLQGLGFTKV